MVSSKEQHASPGENTLFPGASGRTATSGGGRPFEILPRAAFTATDGNAPMEPMEQILRLTIHHSGFPQPWTLEDQARTADHLEYIRRFHTDSPPAGRGWADIGYHFIIDRAGRIWQGRSLLYRGAHVRHHNHHNLGIAVLGNFDLQAPADKQLQALADFVAFIRSIYGIPQMEIWMHRELADEFTTCPGEALLEPIRRLRGF